MGEDLVGSPGVLLESCRGDHAGCRCAVPWGGVQGQTAIGVTEDPGVSETLKRWG